MSPKDHVAVRLDSATLSRIDALKDVLSTSWREATRSDVLRAVILNGLDNLEREHKVALGARRKAAPPEVAPPVKRSAKPKGRSGAG